MTWRKQHISLNKIEEEYIGNPIKDDDGMYILKRIISDELDDLDRALIIVYTEEESMAKTARVFGVSPATICSHIHRIRNIIKNKLEEENVRLDRNT